MLFAQPVRSYYSDRAIRREYHGYLGCPELERLDWRGFSIFRGPCRMPWRTKDDELSSAEDKTSSTILPSQESSNSATEEFSVEAHATDKQEHGSAPSSEARPIDVKASESQEPSPAEPGEDEAAPLKTKPLPKVNAIAREVSLPNRRQPCWCLKREE
jgi:hypothetical protein